MTRRNAGQEMTRSKIATVGEPDRHGSESLRSAHLGKLLKAIATHKGRSEAGNRSQDSAAWPMAGASPLCILGAEGELLFANHAFRRLEQGLEAASRTRLEGALQSLRQAETEPLAREIVVELDGEPKLFRLECDRLDDGATSPAAAVCRLIPQEEADTLRAKLARSEERFNDIVRLLSDWVWETDRELRLTYVSPRLSETLGYHPRELLGLRLDELSVEPIDLFEASENRISPKPFRGREVSLRHCDGEEHSFRLSGLPVFDRKDGEFQGFRGTAQDVTDLLANEAALRQAVTEAEAANRTKSEFLANTSHELRTPLNAIIGFSEIMHLERLGPIGNQRYKEYISDVLESAHHLLTLINDILDVAKIEAGKLRLEESAADPVPLCQQCLRLVADRATRHGITLESTLPRNLPRLRIDERKIKQILLNLLSNAIKFTPPQGRVELAARYDSGAGFSFMVRDTGIGIAPEDQILAFSPFGQVDSQLSRKFEGTGLGLPLSQALARLHGGCLELDSALGAGTLVTVRIPESRVISEKA
jgi:PAS domain S-box-containing protein